MNLASTTKQINESVIALNIVDACPHDFETIARNVLPNYFDLLNQRISLPAEMSAFTNNNTANRSMVFGESRDFSGCYVLLEGQSPVYVGISRGVIKRLTQHVTGNSHYNASLAYRMAKEVMPHKKTRDEAMANMEFNRAFLQQREKLKSYYVAAIRIDNALELYLFEVYAAMRLGTGKWNSFRTH